MKIDSNYFRCFLLLTGLALLALGCQDPTPPEGDPLEQVKATHTQILDIDGDGTAELVIGFKKSDLSRLSSKGVVLKGRFSTASTAFETDEFSVER